MRLLFVKHSLNCPRSRGHDVHTYFMMRALEAMGHELNLMTVEVPPPSAIAGLRAQSTPTASVKIARDAPEVRLTSLQERFRSYWGVSHEDLAAVATVVRESSPDAVIGAGPDVLPYLAVIPGVRRVWYAADDLCWQHLSQARGLGRGAWPNLQAAATNALYERAFANAVDRVWVVSTLDARAVRWFGGARRIDIVPNGVDTDYFRPTSREERPDSAMFWGHLGFAPNVEAIKWFCSHVWPIVRRRRPAAILTVAGYAPSEMLMKLSGKDGIHVVGPVTDLRNEVARHRVAVMPFRSRGGLKNKMLEAAAMGRAIVCSPAALNGLDGAVEDAVVVAHQPQEWAAHIAALWDDESARVALGANARRWVEGNHTWRHAAEHAVASLQQ